MSVLLGELPGAGQISPGGHLCAIFSGAVERDRLLVPFLQEGLRRGDRCVCFMDEVEPERLRRMAYEPQSAGDTSRPGHLSVRAAPEAYLKAGGPSARATISHLVGPPSTGNEYPLLRAAGQMPAMPHEPGGRELFLYESAVLLILGALPAVFLCLYDTERFGTGMIASVLRSHSRILLDGAVLYNPQSVAPLDDLEPEQATGQRHPVGEHRAGYLGVEGWGSLTGAEVRIAELVGQGMTNRATAHELIVSPHTVDAHLKHIYQKLGIHSRAELAVLSFRHRPEGS